MLDMILNTSLLACKQEILFQNPISFLMFSVWNWSLFSTKIFEVLQRYPLIEEILFQINNSLSNSSITHEAEASVLRI